MLHESEEYHVKITPLRGYLLANQLENISFILIKHISNVTFEKLNLNRIIMNFKIDA